jgi:hypothetical protein
MRRLRGKDVAMSQFESVKSVKFAAVPGEGMEEIGHQKWVQDGED